MDTATLERELDRTATEGDALVERASEDALSGDFMNDDFLDEGKRQLEVESTAFAQDPELMMDFVTESEEHFAVIEEHLLLLERDPDAEESIHAVFRAFHTIKGLAGFLELHDVRNVAHEIETLLDRVRNKQTVITPTIVDLVLDSTDYLKDEVASVHAAAQGMALPVIRSNKQLLGRLHRMLSISEEGDHPDLEAAFLPSVASVAVPSSETGDGEGVLVERRADKGSIRVETAKLDQLMDMVGEMVIAQTILSHNPAVKAARDARLEGDLLQLTRITGEVQRCAMIMRMTPISGLFQKTARLVRDLARRAGKNVTFEMSGEQTELDKTIAEELSDPLLHMVRNALDHGIEAPKERVATGKSPEAQLRLFAQHQAGQIVVGISDDGRGLDAGKIFKKAVERGLVQADASLSDKEIYQLIFEPGFSTAEKITDISGRGVGMDVVRKHVERLRGRIEIVSAIGKGTTFYLHLPLTLAVIEGLVVLVGDSRYIIPIFAIQELMRPTAEILFTVRGRDEMVLIRGELLPMVRLHCRLGVTPKTLDPCEGLLIIAESGTKKFALFVDDLIGRQEVVIKSLGDALKQSTHLAGCAVLGDGRVGLILDMTSLYQPRSH